MASFSERAWARLIDEIIVGIPFVFTLFVWFLIVVAPNVTPGVQPDPETLQAPDWLILPAIVFGVAYEVGAIAWRGQTLGKFVLGLRVGRFADGKNPSPTQSALRALLPFAAAALLFGITGFGALSAVGAYAVFATAYANPLRRGLHDQAGGTIVVRTR
jgi:uncharacterized RDD family membrane protein YckC